MNDPLEDWYGAKTPLLSEINVTPFIDVMLVLLIIFMVAAPLMMVGVPLKLPKTTAQTVHKPQRPVVVSLDKDGGLFFDQERLAPDKLSERLSMAIKADPETVVYVRADKTIDYGRIMDLLGKVGSAGVARLSLVAEGQLPPNAPPEP
ncbi:ExbD/TolR family protein [Telmatospirillum siberiense]|uniref:Protein TolR n=1 Tax=Telmatospirillum siberiense TaxID=382514 RepID=A0A2N3PZ00_9PROT|nr:ExbD/TolR family protein [Telmatospirillum siberiense]PKU25609.1 protein TolR [Telmatospirillum siberiense]